jgi:membrane protease YdiL (CAAX protease family)
VAPRSGPDPSGRRAFWTTFALGAMTTPAAVGSALLLSVDLAPLLAPQVREIAIGVAATGPLVLMLMWFMASQWRPVAAFRSSQLQFFREIGFTLTPLRSALLASAAGLGEELLFRGVLQTIAAQHWPIIAALILPNVLFGALHARTAFYAVAAGVVGVYLGVLFWLAGGLAAPMIAHALYDFIALEWARKILDGTAPKV